jgi:hypothetical protein
VRAGGSKGVQSAKAKKPSAGSLEEGQGEEEAEEETYYDALKKEMGGRAARTRAALDSMDLSTRVALEGYRPGTYLRLRFTGGWAARASVYCIASSNIGSSTGYEGKETLNPAPCTSNKVLTPSPVTALPGVDSV